LGARRVIRPTPAVLAFPLLAMLAGCQDTTNVDNATGNASVPRRVEAEQMPQVADAEGLPGTPMAQRVAVIGLLNKRNGITQDLTMKPGEALRSGAAIVRLRACEQSAPWEDAQQTGAFVQLDVQETRDKKWHRVFSGWLFKERPDRNVVQHPIYDVWVKSCTMSWPETGAETVRVEGGASARKPAQASATSSSPSSDASAADSAPTSTPSTATDSIAE
jgi:hypothetical protein